MTKVLIDPGHGGRDPGAVNGNKHEAVAALSIAKKVGNRLKAKGITVKYSRAGNKFVSIPDRCRLSNDFDADLFVSIHLNSATNKKASGIETWRYEHVGPTTRSLANHVQSELIGVTGAKDRGVKTTTGLYVLKHTKASAILIEVGFISNDEEAKKLFSENYQDKIARAIAAGIVKTIG